MDNLQSNNEDIKNKKKIEQEREESIDRGVPERIDPQSIINQTDLSPSELMRFINQQSTQQQELPHYDPEFDRLLVYWKYFGISLTIIILSVIEFLFYVFGYANIVMPIISFGFSLVIFTWAVYRIRKFEEELDYLGRRIVYFGNLKEEVALGLYVGTFTATIFGRTLYGITIENNWRVYRLLLLWGYPHDALTYVRNEKGEVQRIIVRGKHIPLREAVERAWDVQKETAVVSSEGRQEIDPKKVHQLMVDLVNNNMLTAFYISPFGEEFVSQLSGKEGMEKLADIQLENVMFATKMAHVLDEYRAETNRHLTRFYRPLINLYRNVLRMTSSPTLFLSALYGVKASNLEQSGLFEQLKASPDQIEDIGRQIKQHFGNLENLFSDGGNGNRQMQDMLKVLANMQREINDMKQERKGRYPSPPSAEPY